MKNIFLSIGILVAGYSISQVNVYQCGSTYPNINPSDVLNGVYSFYRPCIDFSANHNFLFSGDVHKDIKATEYIHIKENFHAGLFNPNKGINLRIQQKSLFDVAVLNYPDLNTVEKLKKVEFGVDLEGQIEDRIKAFINLASGTAPTLYHLNPFIEDDMDSLTSEIAMHATFIHPQTWTVKERDFFYYHEYEQIGPSYGVDVANATTGAYGWSDSINDDNDYLMRVRFAPPRSGEWEAHFSVTYDGNTIQLPVFTFLVLDNNHPGFVKVHNNKRNLRRDDGIVFPLGHVFPGPYNRANGEQVAWGDPGGIENKTEYNTTVADWNQYLGDIESYINQGGKSFKIAQTSYGNLLEFEELGNYRKRLQYAWEQDKIFEMCEDNDVLVNFNLLFQDVVMGYGQNGGEKPVSEGGGFYGDPWDYGHYNPDGSVNTNDYYPAYCYFKPGELPSHQFLNDTLMNYHKQRTRYYVARYGYSPQIYTWELMSEPFHMDAFDPNVESPANDLNHPGHQVAINAINTYHNELSAYIKNELEDKDHLITLHQAIAVPDDPSNAAIYPYECAKNNSIDIIGCNYYGTRPDKLITGKPDKNGKNNLSIDYHSKEKKNESSAYKTFWEIYIKVGLKPIILSEAGHTGTLECSGNVGNIIDVMTNGFIGVAGMHSWEGYKYGYTLESGVLQYDERQLWPATISAEQHMNSNRVINVLNKKNGLWYQGRQIEKVYTSNDIQPKELQYYLAQDNRSAAGYVNNRSYNTHTMRSNASCIQNLKSPIDNFYSFSYDQENNIFKNYYLYVTGLEKNLLYRTRWYNFETGIELTNSIISETDNKNRLKLIFPDLYAPQSPILWFTIEESYYNKSDSDIEEGSDNERGQEIFRPKVFPVPFSSEFKVQTNVDETIDVFSVSGAFVGSYNIKKGETTIQTNHLEPGMYYIKFNTSNVSLKVNKL